MTHPIPLLPLLLLPGLMNDERVWDPLRRTLPAGRTVVVAATHTADNMAALAESAVEAMPPGPFAVAGFSLGGYVALEVCAKVADRIAGIALLSTGARADSDEAKQNRQRMLDAIGGGTASFSQVAGGFASRVIHPTRAGDRALLELLSDMARYVGTDGFRRQQTAAMHRQDRRSTLETLRRPALVLCGREDQITPVALSEEMAALSGEHVEIVIVPECGHMVTLEQPALSIDALSRWLARVDAANASIDNS